MTDDTERMVARLQALSDVAGWADGGWNLPPEATPKLARLAANAAALLTKEREARAALTEALHTEQRRTERYLARAESAEAEAKRLREALAKMTRFVEERATVSGYGFFRPANPHDFHPDHDYCSQEEIAAHKTACEAWDKGVYQALNPDDDYIRDADGKLVMHILRAPWGIGSYNETDPEAVPLIDAARTALAKREGGEG